VYDLVYNPKETVLIQQARALGLPACGGLGMLVEQAALSFEIWTGSEASRFQMYAVVGEDLVEPSESQEVKHDA
jgi:shikimate dehydrogenase